MVNLRECSAPFLCLVRHGETPFTVARQYNGITESVLTPEGEETARELKSVLGGEHWDSVLCSALSRARRTAELAGFNSPEIVPELNEYDYGDFEGMTTEEILANHPRWNLWRDGCPGGETPVSAAVRLSPLLPVLRNTTGRILVFSHSHAIRILTAVLLGLPPQRGAIFTIDPASINLLRLHRGVLEIAVWNDKSHLEVRTSVL